MDVKALLEIFQMSGEIVQKSVTVKGQTFDVNIKKEMSGADFEFIFASGKNDEDSMMARRVNRLILFGDEKMDYKDALKLPHYLLVALCNAINAVQETDVKKS